MVNYSGIIESDQLRSWMVEYEKRKNGVVHKEASMDFAKDLHNAFHHQQASDQPSSELPDVAVTPSVARAALRSWLACRRATVAAGKASPRSDPV
jgi:hypothetical protein